MTLKMAATATPTNRTVVSVSNNIIFTLKIYQTTNLMKLQMYSLEHVAKVAIAAESANISAAFLS